MFYCVCSFIDKTVDKEQTACYTCSEVGIMKLERLTQKIASRHCLFLEIIGTLKNYNFRNTADHGYLGENFPAGITEGRIDHENFSSRS